MADLHIWDTLGQEKFMAIANMFFKGTVGAFIVFDLCNQKSFDDLDKWYDKLIQGCDIDNVVITLIGNKCDKPDRVI